MVAAEPAERAVEARGIVVAHLSAEFHKRLPKFARRAQRADPVEEDAHSHPSLGAGNERIAEALADDIGAEDVVFKIDGALRCGDGAVPCGVVLLGVEEEADGIPRHERRPGGAGERTLGDAANGTQVFATVAEVLGCGVHAQEARPSFFCGQ